MSESTPPKKPNPKPLDPQRLPQLIVELDAAFKLAREHPEKDGDGFYCEAVEDLLKEVPLALLKEVPLALMEELALSYIKRLALSYIKRLAQEHEISAVEHEISAVDAANAAQAARSPSQN